MTFPEETGGMRPKRQETVVPFEDRKRPNKVELSAGDSRIPEPRKRRFISAVKKRAKARDHAKKCAKQRRK